MARSMREVDVGVDVVEEQSMYAVLSKEDGCWYRGRVIDKVAYHYFYYIILFCMITLFIF